MAENFLLKMLDIPRSESKSKFSILVYIKSINICVIPTPQAASKSSTFKSSEAVAARNEKAASNWAGVLIYSSKNTDYLWACKTKKKIVKNMYEK